MKVIEVSVNYGETINIGNYESRRVDFGMRAALGPGENPDEIRRELLLNCRVEAQKAAERIIIADRH